MQGGVRVLSHGNYGDFNQTYTRYIAGCGFVTTHKKGQSEFKKLMVRLSFITEEYECSSNNPGFSRNSS